jgi:hypothetical protein
MIVDLPITQEGAHFGFGVELSGRSYGFTFRWNDRLEQWCLDVLDGDGARIVSGVRVVVGVPLLQRFRNPALPPGLLAAIDTDGGNVDPGFADLGRRVVLSYADLEDLA